MIRLSPKRCKKILLKAQRAGSCEGFTLIEMLVTLVVITTLLTIAVLGTQNIVKRNSAEELVSELHLARMMAIRQHQTVTVGFNPDTSQAAVAWSVGGAVNLKSIILANQGGTYVFDSTPAGTPAPPAPNTAFVFSPMGFISTDAGNAPGNIYLTNQRTNRSYQIQTNIAGGIDLNRYDPQADTWVSAH